MDKSRNIFHEIFRVSTPHKEWPNIENIRKRNVCQETLRLVQPDLEKSVLFVGHQQVMLQ